MRLETERLVLREFVPDDLAALLSHLDDPRFMEHYTQDDWPPGMMQRRLGWFIEQQEEQPRYRWQMAVTLASTGELIGNCGIRLNAPGAVQAEIGYGFSPDYWDQGYATEAARRMLRFAFEEQGVHRVGAHIAAGNERSVALVQRLGFSPEGRLRENECHRGAWRDTLLYGLLAQEWAAQTA